MSDLISRQAAIEAIEAIERNACNTQRAIDAVMVLPSAQPERKKGHWIKVDDFYNRISGRCSVCGWESHLYEDDVVGMNFCPNCGVDMRGEQDDSN